MVEKRNSWRWLAMSCLLALLLVVAIEGAQLGRFWLFFSDVRHSWVPVTATTEDAQVLRRTSHLAPGLLGNRAPLVHVLGVRVHYALDNAIYHTTAFGWEEPFAWLAALPQSRVPPGREIRIYVDPTNLGRATLLGDWTPPSTWTLAHLIGVELVLVVTLLSGLRATARARRRREAPAAPA